MVLNLLFPRKCLNCRKQGRYFCPACVKKIPWLSRQIFYRNQPLRGVVSCFGYSGLGKTAIKKLKFRFVTDLVEELVGLALDRVGWPEGLMEKQPVLVPVPLHPKRLRWRGFNQAELIAEVLGRRLSWPVGNDLLRRTRMTVPQVELNKKERTKNMRHAFALKQKVNLKHNFILVDDVWTTGATMNECAVTLKEAGAGEIWGFTLAQ